MESVCTAWIHCVRPLQLSRRPRRLFCKLNVSVVFTMSFSRTITDQQQPGAPLVAGVKSATVFLFLRSVTTVTGRRHSEIMPRVTHDRAAVVYLTERLQEKGQSETASTGRRADRVATADLCPLSSTTEAASHQSSPGPAPF